MKIGHKQLNFHTSLKAYTKAWGACIFITLNNQVQTWWEIFLKRVFSGITQCSLLGFHQLSLFFLQLSQPVISVVKNRTITVKNMQYYPFLSNTKTFVYTEALMPFRTQGAEVLHGWAFRTFFHFFFTDSLKTSEFCKAVMSGPSQEGLAQVPLVLGRNWVQSQPALGPHGWTLLTKQFALLSCFHRGCEFLCAKSFSLSIIHVSTAMTRGHTSRTGQRPRVLFEIFVCFVCFGNGCTKKWYLRHIKCVIETPNCRLLRLFSGL